MVGFYFIPPHQAQQKVNYEAEISFKKRGYFDG